MCNDVWMKERKKERRVWMSWKWMSSLKPFPTSDPKRSSSLRTDGTGAISGHRLGNVGRGDGKKNKVARSWIPGTVAGASVREMWRWIFWGNQSGCYPLPCSHSANSFVKVIRQDSSLIRGLFFPGWSKGHLFVFRAILQITSTRTHSISYFRIPPGVINWRCR